MTNCDGLLPGKRGPSVPVVKPGGASSFLSQIQSQMQSKEEMGVSFLFSLGGAPALIHHPLSPAFVTKVGVGGVCGCFPAERKTRHVLGVEADSCLRCV